MKNSVSQSRNNGERSTANEIAGDSFDRRQYQERARRKLLLPVFFCHRKENNSFCFCNRWNRRVLLLRKNPPAVFAPFLSSRPGIITTRLKMEICVYDGGFFIKWINSSAINDRECNYWKTFNFSYFRGTYPEARCHIWLGKGEISEWKGFIGEKSLRQSLDGREARACGGEMFIAHTRVLLLYMALFTLSPPSQWVLV